MRRGYDCGPGILIRKGGPTPNHEMEWSIAFIFEYLMGSIMDVAHLETSYFLNSKMLHFAIDAVCTH